MCAGDTDIIVIRRCIRSTVVNSDIGIHRTTRNSKINRILVCQVHVSCLARNCAYRCAFVRLIEVDIQHGVTAISLTLRGNTNSRKAVHLHIGGINVHNATCSQTRRFLQLHNMIFSIVRVCNNTHRAIVSSAAVSPAIVIQAIRCVDFKIIIQVIMILIGVDDLEIVNQQICCCACQKHKHHICRTIWQSYVFTAVTQPSGGILGTHRGSRFLARVYLGQCGISIFIKEISVQLHRCVALDFHHCPNSCHVANIHQRTVYTLADHAQGLVAICLFDQFMIRSIRCAASRRPTQVDNTVERVDIFKVYVNAAPLGGFFAFSKTICGHCGNLLAYDNVIKITNIITACSIICHSPSICCFRGCYCTNGMYSPNSGSALTRGGLGGQLIAICIIEIEKHRGSFFNIGWCLHFSISNYSCTRSHPNQGSTDTVSTCRRPVRIIGTSVPLQNLVTVFLNNGKRLSNILGTRKGFPTISKQRI